MYWWLVKTIDSGTLLYLRNMMDYMLVIPLGIEPLLIVVIFRPDEGIVVGIFKNFLTKCCFLRDLAGGSRLLG